MKNLEARSRAARKARIGEQASDEMAKRIYKESEEEPEEEESDEEEGGGGGSAAAVALLI